ncbi:MAG: hypothetical protein IIZ22_00480, partial [Clostridia bacterium]|nr:hypothetical protein [Clostridia bacterium]
MFGMMTEAGFVISAEHAASGGQLVIADKGISMKVGSAVFSCPLRSFIADVARRHWQIETVKPLEEREYDRIAIHDGSAGEGADVCDDGDQRNQAGG